jgi:hypothetical protein
MKKPGLGSPFGMAGSSHGGRIRLGCRQRFQKSLHSPQATDFPNDSEQLVEAVKPADCINHLGHLFHLADGTRFPGWECCST